ncbi:probable receptor-like protein kinase At5g20050 [Telopea speciosissima]|uniref:probable receptor-like protein kinase At5g20050 n=1 Tax=Telopea speciosissima TaxID=54955 RepID=UPI001CC36EED|nr:probable receptor-like protein kinase At5g20050 [Telopea speciosissima]
MVQPPGFEDPTRPSHVCRLHRSLYELKQAPRAWFHGLSQFLLEHGFTASQTDPSLFIYLANGVTTYVLVYVDDILVTSTILAIFIWVLIQYRRDNSRRLVQSSNSISLGYSFLRRLAGVPTKFNYKELEVATNNFQSLIGEGASASVYKGKLDDGMLVAVKRLTSEQHGEKEFRAEVAAIASVQHINLVRFLGYSYVVGGPHFLVYEFIHNGSLDVSLHTKG